MVLGAIECRAKGTHVATTTTMRTAYRISANDFRFIWFDRSWAIIFCDSSEVLNSLFVAAH